MAQQAALRFFDPLYGPVRLDSLERQLVMTPEFQRLRSIRMCNINSMLISGASEISRFEHSIGVLHLAQVWGNANQITGDEGIVLRAAALLHDMQTGPFGHSLQYVVEDNQVRNAFVHDDIHHGYQEQFHQRLLATAGYQGSVFSSPKILGRLWDRVAEAIKGEGRIGPLISGSLDLDNLDNVIRLAYHVGVASSEDVKGIPGFVSTISVKDERLKIPSNTLDFVERWQEIRERLYQLLLLDWAEFSAKAMLTLAIEQAFQGGMLDQESWLLTDEQLLLKLERLGIGEYQSVGEVVRRLRLGQLYSPALLVSTADVGLYEKLGITKKKREFEKALVSKVKAKGKNPGKILLHLILDKKKTRRAVPLYLNDDSQTTTVGWDSSELLVGIFSSSDLSTSVKDVIEYEFRSLMSTLSSSPWSHIDDPILQFQKHDAVSSGQLDLGWTD